MSNYQSSITDTDKRRHFAFSVLAGDAPDLSERARHWQIKREIDNKIHELTFSKNTGCLTKCRYQSGVTKKKTKTKKPEQILAMVDSWLAETALSKLAHFYSGTDAIDDFLEAESKLYGESNAAVVTNQKKKTNNDKFERPIRL